jgi:hypothetical protein
MDFEPVERAIVAGTEQGCSSSTTPRLKAASVAHIRGLDFSNVFFPGVPLRSTPGYTLSPALRVSERAGFRWRHGIEL